MNEGLRIVAVLLLVLGNAVFVAAEYALITARRSRLEPRAEGGSRAAATALKLMDEPVRFISTVQVGITVFGILLGAIGAPVISDLFGDSIPGWLSFAIAFLILTYLSVVLGELVPKAISLQKSEAMAVALAIPLNWLGRVFHPIVWVLQQSADGVGRLFGIKPAPAGVIAHTAEDIRLIVAQAESTGEIEEDEREMLYKVFDFADKEVSDVMVPRPEVVALSIDLPPEECLRRQLDRSIDLPPEQCLAAAMEAPYTRYPVYRDSLDTVIGILHVRDLMRAVNTNGRFEDVDVESLLRPAHIVPETKDLAALLHDFRRAKEHMAVVVDEYGTTEGIVTLEDVLEEIVGEIEDEFDLPDESVQKLADGRIRISGTFSVDDFNEQFDRRLPVDDYHTMAGFVFGLLGRAPEPGDEVAHDGTHFKVVDVEGTRIERLEVEFVPVESESGDAGLPDDD